VRILSARRYADARMKLYFHRMRNTNSDARTIALTTDKNDCDDISRAPGIRITLFLKLLNFEANPSCDHLTECPKPGHVERAA
jgi:hypothetical protein